MNDAPYVLWDGHWISSESEMGKEVAKWNKPWKPERYPMMLYRAQRIPGNGKWATGSVTDMGFASSCQKIVRSDEEYEAAKREGVGWSDTQPEAIEWALKLEEAVSTAAAERLYRDKSMSEKAQAEAARFESENAGHQAEIPEQPLRRRPGRPPKNPPAAA